MLLVAAALGGGSRAVLAVGAVGLGLLALTGLLATRPARLEVSRSVPTTGIGCGEELAVSLVLHNRSRLPLATGAVETAGYLDETRPAIVAELPAVLPSCRATVTYRVPATRRGRLRLGPVRLRGDVYGLWRAAGGTCRQDDLLITVRPRVHPLPELGGAGSPDIDGRILTQQAGATQAFHSLRDYVPGDDPRSIHWRSSARHGELVVRHTVQVHTQRLHLAMDTRAGSYPHIGTSTGRRAFEDAVELLASVAVAAVRAGWQVTLTTAGGVHVELGALADVSAALDLLALVEPDASLGLGELVDRIPMRDEVLVITGTGADPTSMSVVFAAHRRALLLAMSTGSDAPSAPSAARSGRGMSRSAVSSGALSSGASSGGAVSSGAVSSGGAGAGAVSSGGAGAGAVSSGGAGLPGSRPGPQSTDDEPGEAPDPGGASILMGPSTVRAVGGVEAGLTAWLTWASSR
ncbi:MAG: DUF58 domain-containing protein [Actinomycetales bacterium]